MYLQTMMNEKNDTKHEKTRSIALSNTVESLIRDRAEKASIFLPTQGFLCSKSWHIECAPENVSRFFFSTKIRHSRFMIEAQKNESAMKNVFPININF